MDATFKWLKHIGDAIFAFIAGGALLQILPALASIASLIWFGIQVYDRIKRGPPK